MALLRNLRGIFSEVRDPDMRKRTLELLKRGEILKISGGRYTSYTWNREKE